MHGVLVFSFFCKCKIAEIRESRDSSRKLEKLEGFISELVERGGCGWIKPGPHILFHFKHHMTEVKHAFLLNCDVLVEGDSPIAFQRRIGYYLCSASHVSLAPVSRLPPPPGWMPPAHQRHEATQQRGSERALHTADICCWLSSFGGTVLIEFLVDLCWSIGRIINGLLVLSG